MAYDYGSIDLGIRNPFYTEGGIRAVSGAIVTILGFLALLRTPAAVEVDPVLGWATAFSGIVLLGWGLAKVGYGVFQTMRFFVGRSVPVSLAPNRAEIDASSDQTVDASTLYEAEDVEQMMMARKNLSFAEPSGWLSRATHSLFPRLTFIPPPYRNLMQRLTAIVVTLLVALVCLGVVGFLTASGLVAHGAIIIPAFMLALIVSLTYTLFRHSREIARRLQRFEPMNSKRLTIFIAASALVPLAVSLFLSTAISARSVQPDAAFMQAWGGFPTVPLLLFLVIGTAVVAGLSALAITQRIKLTNPETRVSEHRDNWQENIHPRDLFVATETLIMAERRFREVPNRQYLHETPNLHEQAESKGSFEGKLMQETQPEYRPLQWPATAKRLRLGTTILAEILLLAMPVFIFMMPGMVSDIAAATVQLEPGSSGAAMASGRLAAALQALIVSGFIAFCLMCFGYLLRIASHLMWAEMTFESLILYIKADGTFTESRLSTGQSIYDSTRSENTVVRSSITPWIIVSRIASTTFAAVGMRNLEFPRMVLTMTPDDTELNSILDDYRRFLDERESLASVTSRADVESLSNFHSVNTESRADYRDGHDPNRALGNMNPDEAAKAAGALRDEEVHAESGDGDER